jgi:isoleucyl-tRNA synthetase
MDHWAVIRTQELVNLVTENLDKYNTVAATRVIEKYIDDLSTWYLRRSRGRKDSEFFDVLRHCLLVSSRTIAPIMPYISEMIFRNLTRRDIPSVHLTSWPEVKKLTAEEEKVLSDMQYVRNMVSVGHMKRKEANVKLRQPLNAAFYAGNQLSEDYAKILAEELNVKLLKPKSDLSVNDIEIDTNLTPELRKEGMARELERLVQGMRKKQGLKVGQVVELSYNTDSEELKAAFELFDTKKTYIGRVTEVKEGGEEVQIDGKKINIDLARSE